MEVITFSKKFLCPTRPNSFDHSNFSHLCVKKRYMNLFAWTMRTMAKESTLAHIPLKSIRLLELLFISLFDFHFHLTTNTRIIDLSKHFFPSISNVINPAKGSVIVTTTNTAKIILFNKKKRLFYLPSSSIMKIGINHQMKLPNIIPQAISLTAGTLFICLQKKSSFFLLPHSALLQFENSIPVLKLAPQHLSKLSFLLEKHIRHFLQQLDAIIETGIPITGFCGAYWYAGYWTGIICIPGITGITGIPPPKFCISIALSEELLEESVNGTC
eukprot:TRINITY_DN443_c0_g1_i2.p1 TRINITY_DN443_c0_g1~~TRINITY_DN443_c0_g1_i2.p1  ORF type:complete len:272 (+),score=40.30 TRINITY_DN443_c0_g1_i2:144-959(+)